MATIYTRADYTPHVAPAWMKRDVVMLVSAAVGMGWKLMIKSGNTATLIAPPPHEVQKIHLSGRRKSGPIQGLMAKVEKYANPLLVPDLDSDESTKGFADRLFHEYDNVVERDVKAAVTHVQHLLEQTLQPEPKVSQREESPVEPTTKTLTLMSEGPMISKSSVGGYASNIATQRDWSDGSVTYHCVRCDFTGPKPLSMASHWRKHVHEDERNRGNHEGVRVDLPATAYTPTEERLASLADRIATAIAEGIDWNNLNEAAKHLAYVALAWENSRHSRGESGLREPLTDTELLNKIRGIVDNGLYQSQQEQIANLAEQLVDTQAKFEAAQADAERLRSNAATLRDLLNEEAS